MLEDCYFGFHDAHYEAEKKVIFERTFCYQNVIKKIKESDIIIVFGRKGNGKSYIAQKLALENEKISIFKYVNYATEGEGNSTPSIKNWKIILFSCIYGLLDKKDINYLRNKDIKIPSIVNKIDYQKANLSIRTGFFNLENIGLLQNSTMTEFDDFFRKVRLENTIFIIFDELDDLLCSTEGRESLSTLIGYLNEIKNNHLKVVCMLRNEVEFLGRSGMKIKSDKGQIIKWKREGLIDLMNKRLNLNELSMASLFEEKIIIEYYEKKFYEMTIIDYILSYTFYRPRDITAFLNTCKSECENIDMKYIDNETLLKILSVYCKEYVKGNIMDEISIYLKQKDLNNTSKDMNIFFENLLYYPCSPTERVYWGVLKGFFLQDFEVLAEKHLSFGKNKEETRAFFDFMLQMGYIGELKGFGDTPDSNNTPKWGFSYDSIVGSASYNSRYILHKSIRTQYIEEFIPKYEIADTKL